MPWWAWMIVAAIALAFEMFVLDAQFYLVFFGISAAIIGFLGLAGVNMPDWVQFLALSILAVTSMLTVLISQMVVVLKDTAIGYQITFLEMVRQGTQVGASYGN